MQSYVLDESIKFVDKNLHYLALFAKIEVIWIVHVEYCELF